MTLHFSWSEILSVTLVLFAVIDILGSIPIIITLRAKAGKIQSLQATLVSGAIMVLFLFLGEQILYLFGLDLGSFALAGSFIIFLIALEMILGVTIFKPDPDEATTGSVVPLAFPLIAGAGTLTTLLSVRAAYAVENIIVGILINLLFVYLVLKTVPWIEKRLGRNGTAILRRVFGIILLSIAIKLFKTNIAILA